MRHVVNKLVTENKKVVGYRVNTLDWKFDLDVGSMRKLFSVVGKVTSVVERIFMLL